MILNISLCCTIWSQTSSDEKEIRAFIKKMEDKWNAHDYSFSGKNNPFVPDAILINPVGMYWKNREEIIKGIQTFGDIRFKHESTKYNKVDVRFLAPAVALVIIQSTDKVDEDYNMPNGTKGASKGETHEGIIGLTLIKKDNAWKIAFQQINHVDASAAAFNPVK